MQIYTLTISMQTAGNSAGTGKDQAQIFHKYILRFFSPIIFSYAQKQTSVNPYVGKTKMERD